MSGLLPTDSDPELVDEERGLRVVQLEDADTDRLLGSLSSETARELFASLHEEPSTASELSDRIDTSLQNVKHHLSNLQEADLVYVADTRYSSKGREMKVYAPSDDALVVCVGDSSSLLDSIEDLAGAVIALLVGSVLVQWWFATAVLDETTPESLPRVGDSVTAAEPVFGFLPPGVAFFAGGLVVLGVLLAFRLWR
ncbi:Transcriptional regulator containing HTH domain,ArsR family [Halalkaliarchaeum sp. AArc-CO]|uniref:ArsR/SmtB family transcription factor n=1 Tax=Halalkaliarchaeum sp. AArc-CO TaxID=2866381 RepID=UPI00217E54A4|nr:helix-turn-helix domain-containing protein [Halalkaliarchaeum sp. AArc-CO]UWG50857.1 Transcriptional regulator containing HTH domain,ArsR family [Halalkaliarchaeum sp. AArc-CO]